MKTGILTICCCIFITPAWANASAVAVTAPPSQPNIKILSEQMDCDQSHNVCVATGNAIAEKLGDSKVKILKADRITTHFAKEGKTGSMRVTRLEAAGDVSFIIGDIIVQGKRGNYLAEEEIAEVFDEVKITNGENQMNGGYGKVNMQTGHYSIKREGERVQALIFTKDAKKEGVRKEDHRVAEK